MLRTIDTLYLEDSIQMTLDQKIDDMIGYLKQMLDGGHLNNRQVARLQQLGLVALRAKQDTQEE